MMDLPAAPDLQSPEFVTYACNRLELSRKQLNVVLLCVDGLTVKLAAKQLGIAPSTVDSHRKRIFKALGVQKVEALVAVIYRTWIEYQGLVEVAA